jgi:hypothetical protein
MRHADFILLRETAVIRPAIATLVLLAATNPGLAGQTERRSQCRRFGAQGVARHAQFRDLTVEQASVAHLDKTRRPNVNAFLDDRAFASTQWGHLINR